MRTAIFLFFIEIYSFARTYRLSELNKSIKARETNGKKITFLYGNVAMYACCVTKRKRKYTFTPHLESRLCVNIVIKTFQLNESTSLYWPLSLFDIPYFSLSTIQRDSVRFFFCFHIKSWVSVKIRSSLSCMWIDLTFSFDISLRIFFFVCSRLSVCLSKKKTQRKSEKEEKEEDFYRSYLVVWGERMDYTTKSHKQINLQLHSYS